MEVARRSRKSVMVVKKTCGYSVISALVKNPKTPPGIATNFVSRMNTFDLKNLRRDKNVPEIIRKMAVRTLEVRERRASPRFVKKR